MYWDVAVKEYCKWHCERVHGEEPKIGYRMALDITLEHDLNLDQVYNLINPKFYTDRGVTLGIACSWV